MKELSQKDLKVIGKFCGDVYLKKLDSIQKKRTDNLVKVVNTGMVSAGKSSLYNALIDSTDEFFKIGASRTTIKANYYDYGSISYIDTPGIDVKVEDDALAFNMVIEADIIMMIHNVRTGPLHKSEVDWLKRIADNIPDLSMRKDRMIFVFSWKDTRERESGYGPLIEDLKKQVFEIVGVEIPCFEVSVEKYRQGVAKGKQVLVDKSGVQELKKYLEDYATSYLERKKEINNREYDATLYEVKNYLQMLIQEKEQKTEEIYERAYNNQRARRSAWDNVFEHFSWIRCRLTELEEELKNM